MEILLVAATTKEVQPLLEAGEQFPLAGGVLHCHLHRSPVQCHLLISGVGIAATAFSLTRAILTHQPKLVMQVGIAGTYDRTRPLGSGVLVTSDRFASLGAEDGERFADVYRLGLANPDEYPFRSGWIDMAAPRASFFNHFDQVRGITSDLVTGSEKTREARMQLFEPVTESMEGAACFYACAQLHVPAVQLRTISNYVEQRDTRNWNIPLAVKQLNQHILDYLSEHHT